MKKPEELLTWCGRDIATMTRDELEQALRQCAALYQNKLEENMERGKFTADLMRMVASR